MSNTSIQDLNQFAELQELSNETAATVQGGAAMHLYRHANFVDQLGAFDGGGLRTLSSNANNQTSSIVINSGRWRFYNLPGWNVAGGYIDLGPGRYNLRRFNDKISSFKRIG
jgi:hypothetical protein